MTERGDVVRTEGRTAYVRFKRSSACGKCHACGMLRDMSEIIVDVENILGAKAGDRVALTFSSPQMLGSSAIAYLFPLAFLILGVVLGYSLGVDWAGLPRDIWAAIFGLALTGLAFLVIRLLEPVFRRKMQRTFVMTAIENKEERE